MPLFCSFKLNCKIFIQFLVTETRQQTEILKYFNGRKPIDISYANFEEN